MLGKLEFRVNVEANGIGIVFVQLQLFIGVQAGYRVGQRLFLRPLHGLLQALLDDILGRLIHQRRSELTLQDLHGNLAFTEALELYVFAVFVDQLVILFLDRVFSDGYCQVDAGVLATFCFLVGDHHRHLFIKGFVK